MLGYDPIKHRIMVQEVDKGKSVRNRVLKSDFGLQLLTFSGETRTKSMKFAIFSIC